MITGEYGKRLVLRVFYDIGSNVGDDGLRLEVTKPDGTAVSYNKATGVELGDVDATITDEKGREYRLDAFQYLFRDWLPGELDQPGAWRVRAVYQDASRELRSRLSSFLVEP